MGSRTCSSSPLLVDRAIERGRMEHKIRNFLCVGAAIVAGSGTHARAVQGSEPVQTTFFVYYHDQKGAIAGRPGVEVSRLGHGAETRLGTTNADGEITLKATNLFAPDSVALLFCDSKFREICTGVRLDSDFLRGFADFNVQLPLAETVDRMRVSPVKR
jgi:hypothetical protein